MFAMKIHFYFVILSFRKKAKNLKKILRRFFGDFVALIMKNVCGLFMDCFVAFFLLTRLEMTEWDFSQ